MFDGNSLPGHLLNRLVYNTKASTCRSRRGQPTCSDGYSECSGKLTAQFFQDLVVVGDTFVCHLVESRGVRGAERQTRIATCVQNCETLENRK